jgi:hypothetical protein
LLVFFFHYVLRAPASCTWQQFHVLGPLYIRAPLGNSLLSSVPPPSCSTLMASIMLSENQTLATPFPI